MARNEPRHDGPNTLLHDTSCAYCGKPFLPSHIRHSLHGRDVHRFCYWQAVAERQEERKCDETIE